ncbi:MAG: hypothetical protein U1F26_07250 [Lysobacterales bacterium]
MPDDFGLIADYGSPAPIKICSAPIKNCPVPNKICPAEDCAQGYADQNLSGADQKLSGAGLASSVADQNLSDAGTFSSGTEQNLSDCPAVPNRASPKGALRPEGPCSQDDDERWPGPHRRDDVAAFPKRSKPPAGAAEIAAKNRDTQDF